MKTYTAALLALLLSTSAAKAFSIPSVGSFDSKETQLKACMVQEAQQALLNGTLTKNNIDSQAVKIATSCATKVSVKQDDASVQLATTVIKGLLK